MNKTPDHVVFFDGVCNLCNSSVNFIIRNDKDNIFHFVSLQDEESKEILGSEHPSDDHYDSVIYYKKGKVYHRSTAALHIAKRLKFPVNLMYGFIIVPRKLRDMVYDYISSNRYKWFGKMDQCMVPDISLKEKFLSGKSD